MESGLPAYIHYWLFGPYARPRCQEPAPGGVAWTWFLYASDISPCSSHLRLRTSTPGTFRLARCRCRCHLWGCGSGLNSGCAQVSLKRLIGAVIGSILGIVGAYLFSLVIRNSVPPGHTQSFLQLFIMLLMAYVGLIVGAGKGDLLNLAALGGIFGGEKQSKRATRSLTPASSSTVASPTLPRPDSSTARS